MADLDLDAAKEALNDLYQFATDALRRPGVLEADLGSNSVKDVRDEIRKATAEFDQCRTLISDAKRRLIASGFEMPDAWVGAEIIHPVRVRRQAKRGYWLELRHDGRDDLEQLADELKIAIRRLQWGKGVLTEAGEAEDPDQLFSVPALAKKYRVDQERLRKKLDYWRQKNRGSKDWTEIENRAQNDPKYLYRFGAVAEIVNSLRTDA